MQKQILGICGSTREQSANMKLLKSFAFLTKKHHYQIVNIPHHLPIFQVDKDQQPWPTVVLEWRQTVQLADLVIITTPEYLHNQPAVLKNALEWLTSSGELSGKRVLPITFTPHPPRGEKAMQSLRWSLTALNAHIMPEISLYQREVLFDKEGAISESESLSLIKEALYLSLN